jgi:hypothetical protein
MSGETLEPTCLGSKLRTALMERHCSKNYKCLLPLTTSDSMPLCVAPTPPTAPGQKERPAPRDERKDGTKCGLSVQGQAAGTKGCQARQASSLF